MRFSRRRQAETLVPCPSAAAQMRSQALGDQTHKSAGYVCAWLAYWSAAGTARTLSAEQEHSDLASLVEALEAVYAIAAKLDEIDDVLDTASAQHLRWNLLCGWSFPGGGDRDQAPDGEESASVKHKREQLAKQQEQILKWADKQSQAKQRWLDEIVALRCQVGDSLLQAVGNVLAIDQELAFRLGVMKAQAAILPLTALDIESDLLTTAGEADKARQLAEAVIEFDLPALASLQP